MFFSVVIPTRNRSHLLKCAIDSVLSQDFTDFELIVSDNSSQKESTEVRAIMQRYDDQRIIYIRPPSELSMSDHWDWALNHPSGKYISILFDRFVYKESALSRIHREICANDFPEAVTFTWDILMGDDPPYSLLQKSHTDKVLHYKSDVVLDMASKIVIPRLGPSLYNSFSKDSLHQKMRGTFGKLCDSVSPEFYFFFHALDLIDEYLYIDKPLFVSHGMKYSNGTNVMKGKMYNKASKDFFKFVKIQGGLKYAPVRMEDEILPLPFNHIYNEYNLAMSRQTSGRFKEIDKVKLYFEIMKRLDRGGEMPPQINYKCKKLMKEYRIQNNIPVNENYIRKTKRIFSRKIKNILKPIVLPGLYFILDNFNIRLFGNDSDDRPKGAFSSVEEALKYDRNHPRTPTNK